jgi:signal transduction histidine kinase
MGYYDRPDKDVFFLLADFMGSFSRSVILAIVGWIENSLVTVQRKQHEQLVEANLKLQKYALTSEKLAQTQERNRLARELHDTLAHTLSSTSVQLEAIKALFDRDPNQAKQMLAQTLVNTKKGLAETRRALVDCAHPNWKPTGSPSRFATYSAPRRNAGVSRSNSTWIKGWTSCPTTSAM